ncbi:MAG: pitrilysin family protein [Bacteroidota bacterium]
MPSPPPIYPVRDIALPPLESGQLSNGLDTYLINMGTQDLVRVELVYYAGRPYEQLPLVSRAATALLKEGSQHHTGAELAEHFDYYGAGFSTPFQMDTGNVVMYALNRHLPEVLPLFIEMVNAPRYRSADLAAFVRRKQQELREDMSKTEVLAYRQVTANFFGEQHPYGYNSSYDLYAQLPLEALGQHHARTFVAGNGFALISGSLDAKTADYIYQQLAQLRSGAALPHPTLNSTDAAPNRQHLFHPGAVQCAIRLGRRMFSRQHPDADGLYILGQLLGGYFGSRLMTNIREDKGYTYNISANYETLRYDGSFQIETEVSPAYLEPCLREIHHEMQRLREEAVEEPELTMLRNYLMGSFLSMVDGPFNWAETIRTLLVEQRSPASFQALIQKVQEIEPTELQALAQKYLRADDFWTVVAGPQMMN